MEFLFKIIKANNLQLLKENLNKKNINKRHFANDLTPLLYAIKSQKLDIVRWLLDEGANVNAQDCGGQTSLHYATRSVNLEIVKLLLKFNNLKINTQCKYGFTALHNAIIYGQIEHRKDLYKYNGNINAKNIYGATWSNYLEIIKLLLTHDADVHVQNENGMTPLHYALCANLDIIKVLLNYSETVNTTLLQLATYYNLTGIIKIIQSHLLTQELWNCWYLE